MSRAISAPPASGRGSPPAPHTDESLLRQIEQGDAEAAADVYLRYAGRLRSLLNARMSRPLARYLEAEDLVQSTFRRFFQSASSRRYALPQSGELWDLLLVIALNRLRAAENFHRAARRDFRQCVNLPSPEHLPDGPDAQRREIADAVREALSLLPPHFREALQLRLEGLEVAEIARRLGRSLRTAERILQQAYRELGKRVEADNAG